MTSCLRRAKEVGILRSFKTFHDFPDFKSLRFLCRFLHFFQTMELSWVSPCGKNNRSWACVPISLQPLYCHVPTRKLQNALTVGRFDSAYSRQERMLSFNAARVCGRHDYFREGQTRTRPGALISEFVYIRLPHYLALTTHCAQVAFTQSIALQDGHRL